MARNSNNSSIVDELEVCFRSRDIAEGVDLEFEQKLASIPQQQDKPSRRWSDRSPFAHRSTRRPVQVPEDERRARRADHHRRIETLDKIMMPQQLSWS